MLYQPLGKKLEYIGAADIRPAEDAFVLLLPEHMNTPQDLFGAYAKIGHFPDYFGHNWDALLDCLRDFSWIDRRQIWIVHEDVPLNISSNSRTYLKILITAIADWSRPKDMASLKEVPEMTYVDHELRVSFPENCRPIIEGLLAADA